jgi:hypothetical protein
MAPVVHKLADFSMQNLPPLPVPPPFHGPVKAGLNWRKIACYFPLLSLVIEVAWCFLLFCAFIFSVGDEPYVNTEAKNRFYDLLCSPPVVFGLAIGLLALTQRWPTRPLEWACLIIGTLLCALWTAAFAWGLVN